MYSVVIPIHNEESNLKKLVEEIDLAMHSENKPWELLCVDDGSTDSSLLILQELCQTRPYMRIFRFNKNFGQSSAFATGFKYAKGEWIITLDGDRQNDPADIPKLIAASKNADLVVGWRINRKDRWQKRIISRLSNYIRSRLCRDGVHDTGCSLKVYRKSALDQIKLYKGMHRFLPALFKIEGFTVKEIPVNHRKRTGGKSNYTFLNRSIGPIIDMFVVRWMRKRALRHQLREEITHEKLR
ncbi:MAG: Dodecaprenyl-phosphate galacturonate synthase [Chlamydiales bacterium]|nr:Dodecaprenyl-phosphate galacturonate synthase [Chlamydiales bacterium]MCH9620539.1 Dodecaprenyl-phosphate galacturonate synthase [Chlamydiales bacterium]MCH9623013.1 Dodecaprenyl-phosphate galacturonate synthase [Chlamydiales bacterium]